MSLTCDSCGKDAGSKEVYCEDCYKQRQSEIEQLEEQLSQLDTMYNQLLEEYNNPLNKFARGEYKKGGTDGSSGNVQSDTGSNP